VENLVLHTGIISQAIYPKMLATAKKEFAEENLQRLLFFAIPILAATIVFAKPALHILNPFYIEGIYIVYFLSFRTLFQILITFSYSVWSGFETIDLNKNASFKQYVKSKLFLIPSLNYIRSGSYVAILALFLILVSHQNLEEVILVTIWSAITVTVAIPFMLQGLISLKKNYQVSFPFKVMLKYSTVALLSSIVVYLVSENFLIYSESIYDFIPQLVPIIILGGIMYFGITYVIDESSRKLFKLIINEFRAKKN